MLASTTSAGISIDSCFRVAVTSRSSSVTAREVASPDRKAARNSVAVARRRPDHLISQRPETLSRSHQASPVYLATRLGVLHSAWARYRRNPNRQPPKRLGRCSPSKNSRTGRSRKAAARAGIRWRERPMCSDSETSKSGMFSWGRSFSSQHSLSSQPSVLKREELETS